MTAFANPFRKAPRALIAEGLSAANPEEFASEQTDAEIEAIARSYAKMFGDDPEMYKRALSAMKATRKQPLTAREAGRRAAERDAMAARRQQDYMEGMRQYKAPGRY